MVLPLRSRPLHLLLLLLSSAALALAACAPRAALQSPSPSPAAPPLRVCESAAAAAVTLPIHATHRLALPADEAVLVTLTPAPGGPVGGGVDFAPIPGGTVTLGDAISVLTVIDDADVEGDEELTVTLIPQFGGDLDDGLSVSRTVVIVDDDSTVVLGLDAVAPLLPRRANVALPIRVRVLEGAMFPADVSVTVSVNPVAGNATADVHYVSLVDADVVTLPSCFEGTVFTSFPSLLLADVGAADSGQVFALQLHIPTPPTQSTAPTPLDVLLVDEMTACPLRVALLHQPPVTCNATLDVVLAVDDHPVPLELVIDADVLQDLGAEWPDDDVHVSLTLDDIDIAVFPDGSTSWSGTIQADGSGSIVFALAPPREGARYGGGETSVHVTLTSSPSSPWFNGLVAALRIRVVLTAPLPSAEVVPPSPTVTIGDVVQVAVLLRGLGPPPPSPVRMTAAPLVAHLLDVAWVATGNGTLVVEESAGAWSAAHMLTIRGRAAGSALVIVDFDLPFDLDGLPQPPQLAFSVLVQGAGLVITSCEDAVVAENGASPFAFNFSLASMPITDVTVSFVGQTDGAADVLMLPSSLVVSAAAWSEEHSFVPQPVDDDSATSSTPDAARFVSVDVFLNSFNPNFVMHSDDVGDFVSLVNDRGVFPAFDFIVLDDERPAVVASGLLDIVLDGNDVRLATFGVSLSSKPAGNVTVLLDAGNMTLVVPDVLTFNATTWNTSQTVVVDTMGTLPTTVVSSIASNVTFDDTYRHLGSLDVDYVALVSVPITALAADFLCGGISCAGAYINETNGVLSYTFALHAPLGAETTFDVSGPGIVPFSFSHPPGSTEPLSLNVSVADDIYYFGNRTVAIAHTVATGPPGAVGGIVAFQVVIIDNEDPPTLAVGASAFHVVESDALDVISSSFSLRPSSPPSPGTNVTFGLQCSQGASVVMLPGNATVSSNDVQGINVTLLLDGDELSGPPSTVFNCTVVPVAGNAFFTTATASFAVNVTEDDFPGIVIDPAAITVSEAGEIKHFDISLRAEPLEDVLVAVLPGSLPPIFEVVIFPHILTFSPLNWSVPVPLFAQGVDDLVILPNETFAINFDTYSTDDGYANLTNAPSPALLTVADNDTAVVLVLERLANYTEDLDGVEYLSFQLLNKPVSSVTVSCASSDPSVIDAVAPVVFSPFSWSTPMPMLLRTPRDWVQQPSGFRTTTVSLVATSSDAHYDGAVVLSPSEFRVLNVDTSRVDLSMWLDVTIDESGEGSVALMQVWLASIPSAIVALTFSLSSAGVVSVNATTAVFDSSNWNVPVVIAVSAIDDDLDTPNDRAVDLSMTLVSGDPLYQAYAPVLSTETRRVTLADDETAGIASSPSTLAVVEGDVRTLQIRLASEPIVGDVTVRVNASEAGDAIRIDGAPFSLVFNATNWNAPRPITLRILDDDLFPDGAVPVTTAVLLAVVSAADAQFVGAVTNVPVTIQPRTFLAPVITAVSPQAFRPCGGTLTVSGAYLGRNAADVSVRIGVTPCAGVRHLSYDRIECIYAPLSAGNLTVITPFGLASFGTTIRTAARPVVAAVSSDSELSRSHALVTITGTRFDTAKSVSMAGVPCDAIVVRGNGTIVVCTLGNAPGAVSGPVLVETAAGCENLISLQFTFRVPFIELIVPQRAELYAAQDVTLTGTDFGSTNLSASLLELSLAGVPCSLPRLVTPETGIVCTLLAQTVERDGPVVLETVVGGLAATSSQAANFSIFNRTIDPVPPRVFEIAPPVVFLPGPFNITLLGRGLNSIDTVLLAGTPCNIIPPVSDPSVLLCQLDVAANSTDLSGHAQLLRSGQMIHDASNTTFRVLTEAEDDRPLITSLAPSAGPVRGGTFVTIRGRNFGVYAPDLASVRIGSLSCALEPRPLGWQSEEEIVCETNAAEGPTTKFVVITLADGTKSYPSKAFTYVANPPAFDNADSNIARRRGGDVITFFGTDFPFGVDVASVDMTVGGLPCTEVVIVSTTELTCAVAPAPADESSVTTIASFFVPDVMTEPAVLDFGFGYVDDESFCFPTCGVHGLCTKSVCSCQNGWTGPVRQCFTPVLSRDVDDEFASEDGDSAQISFVLHDTPVDAVTATPLFDDVASAEVSMSQGTIVFAAGAVSGKQLKFTGKSDGKRDGPAVFRVPFEVTSDDANFHGVYLSPVTLTNYDAAVVLSSIQPKTAPMEGSPAIAYGRNFDFGAVILREGKVVNSTFIVAFDPNGPKSTRSRQAESPNSIQFTLPPESEVGADIEYVVLNVDGSMSKSLFIHFTRLCPGEEGTVFGIYPDCAPCPEGGICPGGDRVWPEEGYWNPDEGSGYVVRCEPADRCLGHTADGTAICKEGHEGFECSECQQGYAASRGICQKCPPTAALALTVGIDAIVWTLIAMAIWLFKNNDNLDYLINFLLMLQIIGQVGYTVTHRMPGFVYAAYSVLHLFSGNVSFVQPDCFGRMEIISNYVMSVGYTGVMGVLIVGGTFVTGKIALMIGGMRKMDAWALGELEEHYSLRLRRASIIYITIVYYSVMNYSLAMLACFKDASGAYRLVTQPSQECWTGGHVPVYAFSWFMVIGLGVGFPVLYFVFTTLRNRELMYSSTLFMSAYDSLYGSFRENMHLCWPITLVIGFIMALSDSVLRDQDEVLFLISALVFGSTLIFTIGMRPFVTFYENITTAGTMVANLIASCIVFMSKTGWIEPRSFMETLLAYTLIIVVSVLVIYAALMVVVHGIRSVKISDDEESQGMGVDKDMLGMGVDDMDGTTTDLFGDSFVDLFRTEVETTVGVRERPERRTVEAGVVGRMSDAFRSLIGAKPLQSRPPTREEYEEIQRKRRVAEMLASSHNDGVLPIAAEAPEPPVLDIEEENDK